MIESIPSVPPLTDGQPPRPFVVLIGAEGGQWQARAAQQLDKQARCVMRTDVLTAPRGSLHPSDQWMALKQYFTEADLIVCWVGLADDVLYLNEWIWVAYALATWPTKMMCGVEPGTEHPMVPALSFLLSDLGLYRWDTLEDTLTMAAERCRELRKVYRG